MGKYYDINSALSHNCFMNFIIGFRSMGKTYAWKKWRIQRFLKTGEQFIYLRRYRESDLKTSAPKFFDDIIANDEFPDVKLKVEKHDKEFLFMVNGEVAGYGLALSVADSYRSVPFPLVSDMCFDEFIIRQRYLKDEVERFLDLESTVFRDRDNYRLWFLGNAWSMTNPYFLYFNIQKPYGKNVFKPHPDILFQMAEADGIKSVLKKKKINRILEGTDFYSYSVDNEFLLDDETFITKKSGKLMYLCTIIHNNFKFGVWVDINTGNQFVSNDLVSDCKDVFSTTLHSQEPNAMYIKSVKNIGVLPAIKKAVARGCLFYESQKIKNIFFEVLKYIL